MKLRKKVLATTVAASLMLGSISGLPLSTQGTLAKLGLSTPIAQAAYDYDLNYFQTFLNELDKDDLGVAKLVAINERIKADQADGGTYPDSFFANMVQPIMTKVHNRLDIVAAAEPGEDKDSILPENIELMIFDIITKIMYPIYDANSEGVHWKEIIVKPEYRYLINQLALLASDDPFSDRRAEFDLEDIIAYGEALEQAFQDQLNLTNPNLYELIKAAQKGDIIEVLSIAATGAYNDIAGTKLGTILATIGVTADDFLKSMRNIISQYDQDLGGIIATSSAIARTHLTFSKTTENNGRTAKPSLKLQTFDLAAIFGDLIQWTTDPSNQITHESGAFRLASNVNKGSTTIEGRFIHDGLNVLLYKGTLDMEFTGTFYGGGGIAPPAPEPVPGYSLPEEISAIVDKANEFVELAKERLEEATNEDERYEIICEIRDYLEATIEALADVDVSSSVVIDGDNGTATVDVAKLKHELEIADEEIDKLNAVLQGLDNTEPNLKGEVTLNFGNIESDDIELTIPLEAMEAIKAYGLTSITVQVNGVAFTYNVDDYQAEITITVNMQDDSVATDVTSMPLATGVYDLEFYVNGEQVTQFISPIELRLPVTNLGHLDQELLSVAKIVDGTIRIFGGRYSEDGISVVRNNLSSFTVIENRVEFTDIGGVQLWAGRAIQVVAAKGIINGRGEGIFDPLASVTRAEFAKMVVLAFGLDDPTATHNFTDVDSSDWFDQYVAAAVKTGVVRGITEDTFEPHKPITREEISTMAARALQFTCTAQCVASGEGALSIYSDATDINPDMTDAVALATKLGIVVGENGQFNPNEPATRAQAAVIIYRLLQQ